VQGVIKVWLNRPLSSISTAAINNMGASVVLAPLVAISSMPFSINKDYDKAIITSANAASRVPKTIKEVIVVGDKSARILMANGHLISRLYSTVKPLISEFKTQNNCNMIYLRGQHVTADLHQVLGCDEMVVYAMNKRSLSLDEINSIRNINYILIYSKRSSVLVKEAIIQYQLNPSDLSVISISSLAATPLLDLPLKQIIIAKSPDELGMMTALGSVT
jgi:hypothetical protein